MGCGIVEREPCGVDSCADFFGAFLSAWVLGLALGLALVRGIVAREREIVGLWRVGCGG